MKKTFYFLLSFLIFAFWVLPFKAAEAALIIQAPKYIGLTNGLVGYWSFDGKDMAGNTAYDRSGNSNNGTLTNGPTRAIGKLGQGLSFDGTAYVAVNANSLPADNVAKTISYWIKFPSAPTSAAVVFQMDNGNNGTYSGFHNLTGCSGVSMGTWKWGGPFLVCTAIPATNTWHHYVYTYDTSTHRLYLNGNLITTGGGATQSTTPNEAYINTAGEHFSGLIDDVRVYNRALSADEIKRLYRIGATLKINTDVSRDNPDLERGLVGLWSFDGKDMAGNTAYDRSGQGNNGTLTNGPTRAIGKIGQGLSFDGVDDYVFVSSSHILTSNNWTAAGWCKVSGAGGDGHNILFESGDDLGATVSGISLRCYRQSAQIGNASILAVVGANSEEVVNSTSPLPLNTWIHVTGVKEGTSLLLYINGALNNSATLSSAIMDYTGDIVETVISTDNSRTGTVKGALDDVRVYNRALSADEIKRLYNLGR